MRRVILCYMLWCLFSLNPATAGPESQCDNGWEQGYPASSSCLLFESERKMNWSDAHQYCQRLGGDLLVVGSREEMDKVKSFPAIKTKKPMYWIGLYRNESNDAVWHWVDGLTSSESISWAEGEPNGHNRGEDCGEITMYPGYSAPNVDDASCNKDRNFICEKLDHCSSSPCTRGECISSSKGFDCRCPEGYDGITCDIETDHCSSSPCTRGECSSSAEGFQCICPPGYTGISCDDETDYCGSSPCTRGECSSSVEGFQCVCPPGYSGITCDDESQCDSGWEQGYPTASSCLLFESEQTKNWHDARQYCQRLGADLLVVGSREEMDKVRSFPALETGHTYWIGLYRDEFNISVWHWVDGLTSSENISWAFGEPNGHDHDEDCGEIALHSNHSTLGVSDAPCSVNRSFICEVGSELEAPHSDQSSPWLVPVIITVVVVTVLLIVAIIVGIVRWHSRASRQNEHKDVFSLAGRGPLPDKSMFHRRCQ